MNEVELSVVIVSYNVRDFLDQCLTSLERALRGIAAEVWVVDNASTDGSAAMVRRRYPWVQLVENHENVGFARANNQALKKASGRYVCLLNPDTLVQEDTFRVLLDFLRHHDDAGMVGCKVLNPDGTLQLACRRSYPTPWVAFTKLVGLSKLFPRSRLFGRYNLTYLDPDKTHPVEAISGSFMLFRRELLEDVGYLDESYFMYGEDLDYCYRTRQAGWQIYYVPQTQVVHFKGESWKRSQLDRLRHFYQAMRLFVRRHFHRRYGLLAVWVLTVAIWIRAAISMVGRAAAAVALPFLDLFWMNVSLALAQLLRFGSLVHFRSYLLVDAVYSTVWLLSLYATGVYGRFRFSAVRAGVAVVIGLLVNSALTFFFNQYAFSRAVVLYAGALNAIFLTGWRLLALAWPRRGVRRSAVRRSLFGRRTLVVGDAASGATIIERLRSRVDGAFDVAGLVSLDEREVGERVAGVPVIGTVREAEAIIRREKIEEVIFSTDKISYDQILAIISRTAGRGPAFKLVPDNLEVIIGKASIDRLDQLPMVDLEYRLYSPPFPAIKRAMDVLVASFGLLIGAVPFAVACLLGLVRCKKEPAYAADGSAFSVTMLDRGPRWLRNYPLLWHVLTGRLSLVGRERNRKPRADGIALKGGLTGLVQLYGAQGLSEEEKERYDLYYVRNYSPLVDLEILLRSMLGPGKSVSA